MVSNERLWIDALMLSEEQNLTYINAVKETYQGQWTKETDRQRKSQGNRCYQHDLRMMMMAYSYFWLQSINAVEFGNK